VSLRRGWSGALCSRKHSHRFELVAGGAVFRETADDERTAASWPRLTSNGPRRRCRRALADAGFDATNRHVRELIHDLLCVSSGRSLLTSTCLGDSRRRLFLKPHRRQGLAAGNGIRKGCAHATHKFLLILRVSKVARGDFGRMHLQVGAHEFRMSPRRLFRINTGITQGARGRRALGKKTLVFPRSNDCDAYPTASGPQPCLQSRVRSRARSPCRVARL